MNNNINIAIKKEDKQLTKYELKHLNKSLKDIKEGKVLALKKAEKKYKI